MLLCGLLNQTIIFSDGMDIDDISPPRDEPDDQDDSSNSSTEKIKGRKRPLRNRDSNIEAKISKNQNDSKLFGVSLTGEKIISMDLYLKMI